MTEKKLWTPEDELEFQIGDMNGIAFEPEVVIQKPILQVKKVTNNKENSLPIIVPKTTDNLPVKFDSNDRPDFITPAEPYYIERYEGKKKK